MPSSASAIGPPVAMASSQSSWAVVALANLISAIYPPAKWGAEGIRRGLEGRPSDMVGPWDPDQKADPYD